jgi:hypothetical protein
MEVQFLKFFRTSQHRGKEKSRRRFEFIFVSQYIRTKLSLTIFSIAGNYFAPIPTLALPLKGRELSAKLALFLCASVLRGFHAGF